jgi:hypothetical protein
LAESFELEEFLEFGAKGKHFEFFSAKISLTSGDAPLVNVRGRRCRLVRTRRAAVQPLASRQQLPVSCLLP